MNQDLIQANDNYGAVTDEFGNTTIITKENNNVSFETILNMENEIENLNHILSIRKSELKRNSEKILCSETINLFTIVGLVVVFNFVNSILSVQTLFFTMLITYIFPKLLNITTYGTRLSRISERKYIKHIIKTLKRNINEKEKSLQEVKINTKYNVITAYRNSKTSQNAIVNSCDKLMMYMEDNDEEPPKNIKVLQLKK